MPDQVRPDLAIVTISSFICEVLPLVCPALEPERAVTHAPVPDALQGATVHEAQEQDATLPLSRERVALLSEAPDATHVEEQRALQARDVLLALSRAFRGEVRAATHAPELGEILSAVQVETHVEEQRAFQV